MPDTLKEGFALPALPQAAPAAPPPRPKAYDEDDDEEEEGEEDHVPEDAGAEDADSADPSSLNFAPCISSSPTRAAFDWSPIDAVCVLF
jgi:hypothetical protein